ncbi:pentapeptide repeat-containing protein [Candidatus Jidaibacter acanthamoebae]|nr:pentapeptide repeat-containing protein [Candidatus Jidaibacter acanthamoeba]
MRDANLEPLNEINIELEEKRKAWSGIYSAIDYFLEGKNDGLLESAIKAFLPEEKAKKAPAISFGLIFKSLSFAILHPIHAFNLIKLALSSEIAQDPDFLSGLIEKESFTNFTKDLSNKRFIPHIGKYLEQNNYITSSEIRELTPLLREISISKSNKIQSITKNLVEGNLFVWVEKVLDLATTNPELKNFISKNPTLVPRFAKKLIEENEILKSTTKNYKFESRILDILNIVLTKPQEAQTIVYAINNNNYIVLSKKVLELLNDPNMVGMVDHKETSLKELIKKQAQDGLFTNLIVGILEQDKKEVEQGLKLESESISKKAEQFGILAANIFPFVEILPSLVDKPEVLQNVFNDFVEGRFVDMSANLASLVNENKEIKDYLTKNSELIAKVLDKVFQNAEELKEYGLKGSLYELVPHLLNHSGKLIGIIDIYQDDKITDQQKYLSIAKNLLEITKNDENVRKYFAEKSEIIVGVLDQVLPKVEVLNEYGLKGNLYELVPHLLNHSGKLIGIIDIYQDDKITDQQKYLSIAKNLLEITKNDENVRKYFAEKSEIIVGVLDQVLPKVEVLNDYGLKGSLYELVPHLLNHSDKLVEIIDAYGEGKSIKALRVLREIIKNDLSIREELKAQFEVNRDNIIDLVTERLERSERIPQVIKGRKAGELVVNIAEGAIQVADKIAADIENTIEGVKKQKKFDQAMENKIEQTGEDKKPEQQVKYDDILIDGRDLSGRDFINTSFDKSVIVNTSFNDSKFTNTSFKGTTLENVSFKGAVIDAATLKTMVESLKLGGDLNLGGAKLIGDFSGIDLRGISLADVDLSEAELPDEKSISDVIKANLMEGLKKNMLPHNKSLGEYLIQKFEHEEIDVNFELDPDYIYHVADYKENINLLASEIYRNLDNPKVIELIIVSDMIADKITQNLFGEGENRGVDGYNIRLMMKEVIKELSGQSINVENLIETKEGELKLSSKSEKIVGEVIFNSWGKGNATGLSKIFYDASKYTGAGLVSGGIYLPEEAFNEQLENAVKDQLNKGLGIEITKSHQDRYSESNNKNISLSL